MRHALLILLLTMPLLLPFSGCSLVGPQGPTAWQVEGVEEPALKRGPRSIANIEENIQRVRPRIDYFFESRIMPLSNRAEKLVIRMKIDPSGLVSFATIAYSSIKNPEFEKLIVKVLTNSSFDEWKQGAGEPTLIEYPFRLRKWYD